MLQSTQEDKTKSKGNQDITTHHQIAHFFLVDLTEPLCVKELKVMPTRSNLP